jgi:hypothetical protein
MFGVTSALQVMNVGESEATVELIVSDPTGEPIDCGAQCRTTIAAGHGYRWWLGDLDDTTDRWYGSAWIESDQPLAAVVADMPVAAWLDLSMYTGLRAPGEDPTTYLDHHMPLALNQAELGSDVSPKSVYLPKLQNP